MTLLSDFARNVANAPSTTAANDRSTVVVTVEGVETIPTIPQWPQSVSSSTPMLMNPSILLACSPGSSPTGSVQSLQAKLLAARRKNELLEEIERGVDSDGYPLCQYRKTFLGHLKGKAIVMSTLRVSIQQATAILVAFISEQLELDLKRNIKVNEGELTQLEADLEAEEWEKIEWQRRWKIFPIKFFTALAKYHAVTLILRSYEFLAAKVVNLKQLDKLTTDPFAISKRLATKLKEKNPLDKPNPNSNNEKLTTMLSMTQTSLWANLLPFFSDYSLHQGLLCYGYYKYYSFKRQRRIVNSEVISPADPDEQEEFEDAEKEAAVKERNILVSDLADKSSRLAANRCLGWYCSAVGSGIGSVVYPGWGTIIGSSLCDAAAGTILGDGYHKALSSLEEQQRDAETKDDIHKAQVQ